MLISHTSTPGRVYQMSSEHHVRNEVKLDHVANWEIYALQTRGGARRERLRAAGGDHRTATT